MKQISVHFGDFEFGATVSHLFGITGDIVTQIRVV